MDLSFLDNVLDNPAQKPNTSGVPTQKVNTSEVPTINQEPKVTANSDLSFLDEVMKDVPRISGAEGFNKASAKDLIMASPEQRDVYKSSLEAGDNKLHIVKNNAQDVPTLPEQSDKPVEIMPKKAGLTPEEMDNIVNEAKESWKYLGNSALKHTIAPIGALLEGAANELYLTDSHKAAQFLKDTTNWIKDYEAKHYSDPDAEITGDDAIGLISLLIPYTSFAKTYKGVAAAEGAMGMVYGTAQRGETGDWVDLASDAALGAGGAVATKGVATAVGNKIARTLDDVSPDVMKFANRLGVPEAEVRKTLEGVPKDHQAYTIAMKYKDDSIGVLNRAIEDSDDALREANRIARARTSQVLDIANTKASAEHMAVAKQNYADMINKVDELGININTTELGKGIKLRTLDNTSSPAKSLVNDIVNKISKDGELPLSEAITLRKDINDVLRKASNSERVMLNGIKRNLDEALEAHNIPEPISDMVRTATRDYAKASQNVELGELLNNSLKDDRRLNYGEMLKKIQESGIHTDRAKETVEVLKEYEKRFGNEYRISSKTKGTDTNTGALGFYSAVLGFLKSTFYRVGEGGNNIVIQNMIQKDLLKSKTPIEFASNVAINERLPQEVRNNFLEVLSNVSKIDSSALEQLRSSKVKMELANKAKTMNQKLRGSEQIIAKKKLQIDTLESRITSLKLEGKSKALAEAQRKLNLYKRDLELQKTKYDEMKTAYDDMNVVVENINGFNNLKEANPLLNTKKGN